MATKDITDLDVVRAYEEARRANTDTRARMVAGNRCHLWRTEDIISPADVLARQTGQPRKVCIRAMERADDHDLIFWGVSLESGHLTGAGLTLLEENDHARSDTGEV